MITKTTELIPPHLFFSSLSPLMRCNACSGVTPPWGALSVWWWCSNSFLVKMCWWWFTTTGCVASMAKKRSTRRKINDLYWLENDMIYLFTARFFFFLVYQIRKFRSELKSISTKPYGPKTAKNTASRQKWFLVLSLLKQNWLMSIIVIEHSHWT